MALPMIAMYKPDRIRPSMIPPTTVAVAAAAVNPHQSDTDDDISGGRKRPRWAQRPASRGGQWTPWLCRRRRVPPSPHFVEADGHPRMSGDDRRQESSLVTHGQRQFSLYSAPPFLKPMFLCFVDFLVDDALRLVSFATLPSTLRRCPVPREDADRSHRPVLVAASLAAAAW